MVSFHQHDTGALGDIDAKSERVQHRTLRSPLTMAPAYRTANDDWPAGGKFLAIIDAWILALWIGGLLGFALIFAPVAFRAVPQLDVFAALTATILDRLATLGYVCGAISIGISLLRSLHAADRRLDLGRVALVVIMLTLVTYQSRAIVPRMQSTMQALRAPLDSIPKTDPRRVAYDNLHQRSSLYYGTLVLLGLVTIALGAVRGRE